MRRFVPSHSRCCHLRLLPAVSAFVVVVALLSISRTLDIIQLPCHVPHSSSTSPQPEGPAINAERLQQQQQQQQQQQAVPLGPHAAPPSGSAAASAAATPPPELLCGGLANMPSVAASLASSTTRLLEAVAAAFEPYASGFTLRDVQATADNLKIGSEKTDVRFWVEVRNKTIMFPRHEGQRCGPPCNDRMVRIKQNLERGMWTGRLLIPEGVPFLLNIDDPSLCIVVDGNSPCVSPLLSLLKSKFDRDILVPSFTPDLFPQFSVWETKRDIAFFRGSPTCSSPGLGGTGQYTGKKCVRWHLAELTANHPNLLNATITENVTAYGGPLFVPGPQATHEEHVMYRYLLALDGTTAAFRLAFLLATNSVVLKQTSSQLEWYYVALQSCVHYLPFWETHEDDVLQLVAQLQASPENQLVAQHVAAIAQAFALSHLTEEATFKYWQRVIDKYVSLFKH